MRISFPKQYSRAVTFALLLFMLAVLWVPSLAWAANDSRALDSAESSARSVAVYSTSAGAQQTEAEPNNTLATANAISFGREISGSITSWNDDDCFKFTLDKAGCITLSGESFIDAITVRIYDAKGSDIWTEYGLRKDVDVSSLTFNYPIDLTAGTYYILFRGNLSNSQGNYRFKIAFASAEESFREAQGGSNNTAETASQIELGKKYNGQIALNDKEDYYKFTLNNSGTVFISGTSYLECTTVIIYDARGNSVWSELFQYRDPDTKKLVFSWSKELPAGTYRIEFEGGGYNHTGNYNFALGNTDIATAIVSLPKTTYPYTGSAIEPKPTVTLGSTTLKEGSDYTLSYKNNVNEGTATVTVTGTGSHTGSKSVNFTITKPSTKIWYRLDGDSKFETMRKIVAQGWSANAGGTVIIATAFTYQDALSAASVAGKYKAPILVTDYYKLTSQTKAELDRLRPTNIIIVGGEYVVTPAVKNALQNLSYVKRVDRVAGGKASDTAAKVARTYFPRGTTNTAILATSQDFRDALSASPIAYAKGYPIFLVDSYSSISNETLKAMKDCGITRVVIVGGKYVVSPTLESKLRANGVRTIERKAGDHYWDTSHDIAQWGLTLGMSANNMGVATGYDYSDALCGAPLCGKNNAVLVLTEHNRARNTDIPKSNKAKIKRAYVFGGEYVVEPQVMTAFENTTK